jgi:SAM-dependent methyltransferase
MNWYLRELGGTWTWADIENKSISEMSELLGEEVHHVRFEHLPFDDRSFDIVVTIDVHEHLKDPATFNSELARILKDNGRVIVTVPSGDRRKFVNILKNRVGMTKDEYGHVRDGYSADELGQLMGSVNLEPVRVRTFSRFFTELVELAINFAYVKKFAKQGKEKVEKGTIAPATEQQLKSVEKVYRLYSLIFPVTWLFSKLDFLLFFTRGYVVVVEGKKRVPA